MTLSTTQKNYIATHFGRSNCYASSGVSYTDVNGMSKTGSTQDVVTTLQMGIGSAARGPGGETYMSIPNFASITDSDLSSLRTESYCVGGSTPAPPPPVTGGCTLGTRRCNGDHVEACIGSQGGPNIWRDLGDCEFGCYGGVCRSDPSPPSSPPPSGRG